MSGLSALINRGTVPTYTKMKTIESGNSVVNAIRQKYYDYYKCDYCGSEIKIKKKRHEMTGGIAIIPHTITRRGELKLALCSKCLKPALKELEGKNDNSKSR